MAGQTRARVFYYGLDPSAELWADEVVGLGLEGIRFRIHYHDEMLSVRVPLIGRHSVHTALRAAAVGLTEGLSWGEIIEGLRTSQTQLRLVAVQSRKRRFAAGRLLQCFAGIDPGSAEHAGGDPGAAHCGAGRYARAGPVRA